MRTIKYELEAIAFKHKGFHALKKPLQTVTLEQVNKLITKTKDKSVDAYNFVFPKAKVIGSMPLKAKVNVTAVSFSKGAKQSIEKAGGTATTFAPIV